MKAATVRILRDELRDVADRVGRMVQASANKSDDEKCETAEAEAHVTALMLATCKAPLAHAAALLAAVEHPSQPAEVLDAAAYLHGLVQTLLSAVEGLAGRIKRTPLPPPLCLPQLWPQRFRAADGSRSGHPYGPVPAGPCTARGRCLRHCCGEIPGWLLSRFICVGLTACVGARSICSRRLWQWSRDGCGQRRRGELMQFLWRVRGRVCRDA